MNKPPMDDNVSRYCTFTVLLFLRPVSLPARDRCRRTGTRL